MGEVTLRLSEAEAADLHGWLMRASDNGITLRQEAATLALNIGDRLHHALANDAAPVPDRPAAEREHSTPTKENQMSEQMQVGDKVTLTVRGTVTSTAAPEQNADRDNPTTEYVVVTHNSLGIGPVKCYADGRGGVTVEPVDE